jgi:hypothetical protein
MSLTRNVRSDVYSVGEEQAEDDPWIFVRGITAFALGKFLIKIVTSEDTTQHASYP